MKFIYYLVFFFWYLLSLLPLRVLYFISDVLFVPLFYGLKYRRDIVHRNIAGSFPEKSEKEILKIEKEFYHFFLRLCGRNHQVVFHVEKADDEAYDF